MKEISYICCECNTHGVKLWRQYQTFLEHITLKCRACSELEQGRTLESDVIGWRVPALPDDTGTFWGYMSAPQECWDWWNALPEKNLWRR